MNRIYLTPKKNKKESYWIKDRLDEKKIGKLIIKNNRPKIKLKKQFKHYNLKQEVLMTFNEIWDDFYRAFINEYNLHYIDDENYNFPLFIESIRLKPCESDMFNRPTLLHPAAKRAWVKMKKAAHKEGVELQIISAFRSLDYQKTLINNKLDKGLAIETILKVNTLPGYSEHHTGCAIDIGCKGEAVLEEAFDQSKAFKWLVNNANKFEFTMTYPKGNTTGICYEPWHWCFNAQ
jgi:D-alanyl-D-alanine carboxypeptidase